MSALFIAGAGTDVGKTYVTARLVREAARRGHVARALKPVASGTPDLADPAFLESDCGRLLLAQSKPIDAANVAACSPWRYAAALSPDMAARAEGRTLSLSELSKWTGAAIASPLERVFVEGVGGIMSPVCEDATNLDWIVALGCPVLLVAGSYLGAISHCLTALEALRGRGVRLAGVVVNESADSPVDLDATAAAIGRFAHAAVIAALRRGADALPASIWEMAEVNVPPNPQAR